MIITTRMPALRHSFTAAGTLARKRIGKADKADIDERNIALRLGMSAVFRLERRFGHGQKPDALCGEIVDLAQDMRAAFRRQAAQFGNRFGRALGVGRDGHAVLPAPHIRGGEQIGANAIALQQAPRCCGFRRAGRFVDGAIHGIGGHGRARAQAPHEARPASFRTGRPPP